MCLSSRSDRYVNYITKHLDTLAGYQSHPASNVLSVQSVVPSHIGRYQGMCNQSPELLWSSNICISVPILSDSYYICSRCRNAANNMRVYISKVALFVSMSSHCRGTWYASTWLYETLQNDVPAYDSRKHPNKHQSRSPCVFGKPL